jgi:hypothetical protein
LVCREGCSKILLDSLVPESQPSIMAFRSAVLEPRPKLNLRPGLSMCGIAVNIAKLPELLKKTLNWAAGLRGAVLCAFDLIVAC